MAREEVINESVNELMEHEDIGGMKDDNDKSISLNKALKNANRALEVSKAGSDDYDKAQKDKIEIKALKNAVTVSAVGFATNDGKVNIANFKKDVPTEFLQKFGASFEKETFVRVEIIDGKKQPIIDTKRLGDAFDAAATDVSLQNLTKDEISKSYQNLMDSAQSTGEAYLEKFAEPGADIHGLTPKEADTVAETIAKKDKSMFRKIMEKFGVGALRALKILGVLLVALGPFAIPAALFFFFQGLLCGQATTESGCFCSDPKNSANTKKFNSILSGCGDTFGDSPGALCSGNCWGTEPKTNPLANKCCPIGALKEYTPGVDADMVGWTCIKKCETWEQAGANDITGLVNWLAKELDPKNIIYIMLAFLGFVLGIAILIGVWHSITKVKKVAPAPAAKGA